MMKFSKGSIIVTFLTALLTFFLLGVFFSDAITNSYVKNVFNRDISLEGNINNTVSKKEDLDLNKFWEVYDIIKKDYYGVDGLDKQELIEGAIEGMVSGLGDKFSEYMSTKDAEEFNRALSGDFEGIGAVVEKNEVGVVIERIIKGSPAKKYGLIKGDIIIKADGEELQDLNLYDAVAKIKGPAKTHVLLTILRPGEKDILEIDVVRDKIKIPSVDSHMIEGTNIGYIALNLFGQNTSREFEKALEEMKDADGLIIDLRDNGGGYLNSAVDIVSNFLKEGEEVVTVKYRSLLDNEVYKSRNIGEVYDKKVVVLINENSASASEITAGALRDQGVAILVGKKSYGKGSVQNPYGFEDGSQIKLTIAKWFTPAGRNIDHEGIEPDIEVDFEKEDYENEYDRQLEEAEKILNDYIELGSIGVTVDKYKENKEEE